MKITKERAGRMEARAYACKLCYFYEKCKYATHICDMWLHWEYPVKYRRRDYERVL